MYNELLTVIKLIEKYDNEKSKLNIDISFYKSLNKSDYNATRQELIIHKERELEHINEFIQALYKQKKTLEKELILYVKY